MRTFSQLGGFLSNKEGREVPTQGRSRVARAKSESQPLIEPPQLGRHLPVRVVSTLDDHVEYSSVTIARADLTGQTAHEVRFEEAHIRRSVLNRTRLHGVQVLDARFQATDLSGAEWERARFRRVEFIGCRLSGIMLLEADLEDVKFIDCNLEGAQFASTKFRRARFDRCISRGVSFDHADLAGVVFAGSDLTSSDFREAVLQRADLRGSNLSRVQVRPKELRGAIIDRAQAVQVAILLGVIVAEEDERPSE